MNDPIMAILLAFLPIRTTLLWPTGCCFIRSRTWKTYYILFLFRKDLAKLFRWRVRLLHETAYIVKLILAYFTKLVSWPAIDRHCVVFVVHFELWMAAAEDIIVAVARAEISHRNHILLKSTMMPLLVTHAVLLRSKEVRIWRPMYRQV